MMAIKEPKRESMTKSQLADKFGISGKTMSKWLDKLPPDIGRPFSGYFFTPGQVEQIYKKLDSPELNKD